MIATDLPDKTALRRALRARRRAFVAGLDPAARHRALETLAGHVLPRLGEGGIVAGYVAIGSEVDPLPVLAAAHGAGHDIALPVVVDRATPLRFVRWVPGDALEAGPFGLLQPAAGAPAVTPDTILTPLVGFDRALNRLGQGAGHYDRAFAALPGARRIGIAWACQQADALPADPWDMPLHAIATERAWIESHG